MKEREKNLVKDTIFISEGLFKLSPRLQNPFIWKVRKYPSKLHKHLLYHTVLIPPSLKYKHQQRLLFFA